MGYSSEAAKVRDMPNVMNYITGRILDVGCGPDKILPNAIGVDGRPLEGVDIVFESPHSQDFLKYRDQNYMNLFDSVFSSHFLEHVPNQWEAIMVWWHLLTHDGYLILYLPDGRHYNNQENPEHMIDMNYDQFIFWFKRSFCGEGKDFRGDHLTKMFDLIDSGLDIGEDRYSFYVIARKV